MPSSSPSSAPTGSPPWARAASDALDEPNDYVRLEIAAALAREIPIIPVLVRGAKVPQADALPREIADLAYRNGVELTHSRWKSDLQILIHALEPFIAAASDSAPAVPQTSPAGRPTPAHPVSVLPANAVEVVGKRLALFIGPIAELVVRRAALRSHSLDDLYNAVSEEIESPTDRKKFLGNSSG